MPPRGGTGDSTEVSTESSLWALRSARSWDRRGAPAFCRLESRALIHSHQRDACRRRSATRHSPVTRSRSGLPMQCSSWLAVVTSRRQWSAPMAPHSSDALIVNGRTHAQRCSAEPTCIRDSKGEYGTYGQGCQSSACRDPSGRGPVKLVAGCRQLAGRARACARIQPINFLRSNRIPPQRARPIAAPHTRSLSVTPNSC